MGAGKLTLGKHGDGRAVRVLGRLTGGPGRLAVVERACRLEAGAGVSRERTASKGGRQQEAAARDDAVREASTGDAPSDRALVTCVQACLCCIVAVVECKNTCGSEAEGVGAKAIVA